MFKKLVALEPLHLIDEHMKMLENYAETFIFYDDIPKTKSEIISRISDADGLLVSYTSQIDEQVLAACGNLRYIGMCCSLLSKDNVNVAVRAAEAKGITVTGVKGYGDVGVGEYAISALAQILHGFGDHMWKDEPLELTQVKIGIMGLGHTGTVIAEVLNFFNADLYYYSRTRKPELEQKLNIKYMPMTELLPHVDILCTCLNRNVVLMGEAEFNLFGNGKIFMNTSVQPSHEIAALAAWLDSAGNYALADSPDAIDPGGELLSRKNVIYAKQPSGLTSLARKRLGEGAIKGIEAFSSQKT